MKTKICLAVALWLSTGVAMGAEPNPVTESNPETEPSPVTVVSRHVGVKDYCAWPNITQFRNGTLAAVIFNKPSHGGMEGEVECWTSADGKTWQHAGNPAPHDAGTNRMNVACGLNAQGELVVLASGWSLKPAAERKTGFAGDVVQRLWCSRSSDGGKTWSINKQGFPQAAAGYSEYIPFGDIVIATDGSLRATAYAIEGKETKNNDVWMFRSEDGGSTWTRLAEIAQGHNETALCSLGKGQWLAAARQGNKVESLDLYRSEDDGRTWKLQQPLTGKSQHPADFTRLDDGRLLLSYGNRRKGAYGVQAQLSSDGGWTWGPALSLVTDCTTGDCGYPANVQMSDGTILTGYYAKGTTEQPGYQFSTVLWQLPAAPSVAGASGCEDCRCRRFPARRGTRAIFKPRNLR